jgi:hypothetical protein
VTPSRALLLVLAVVSVAALAGVLVGTSDSSSDGAARVHERLLAKAKPAPKLPTYEPGSAWPSLPPPPEPIVAPEPESSEEAEGYVATSTPEPIYYPPSSDSSSGAGGRPHGITGGGSGCAC